MEGTNAERSKLEGGSTEAPAEGLEGLKSAVVATGKEGRPEPKTKTYSQIDASDNLSCEKI